MDPELDRLLRDELLERSRRVSLALATTVERLASSLETAADSLDRLAAAEELAAARRRAAVRRPGGPARSV